MSRFYSTAACTLALAGCVTQPATQYSWGHYEDVIYTSYASHGDVPVEKQIEIMEKDYQAARAGDKRLPPGWHAHLAYLYYEKGDLEQARQELRTEKAEFPESAVLMDRLLANLQAKNVQKP